MALINLICLNLLRKIYKHLLYGLITVRIIDYLYRIVNVLIANCFIRKKKKKTARFLSE